MLSEHWEELLLQYIGVITCAICGILAAVLVPFAGFCVCCCRCAGKCGGYPEHFDKRGDACRRVSIGVMLSAFAIGAMFGVVSVFVTNQVCSIVRFLHLASWCGGVGHYEALLEQNYI